jgi:hypothetical protein
MDEEVDATDAGRGGWTLGVVKFRRVVDLAPGRVAGLGVTLPGRVAGETESDVRRVFTGDIPRTVVVEDPAVDWRGRPTGVTKLFEVPEIVRARGCAEEAGVGFFGVATFSAFDRGMNIPDVGVDVEKYRIPETLPSFFPWYW